MSKKLPQLTEAEFKKVLRALAMIEEAQNLISAAARELCPVPGFVRQWEKSHKVYEHVKNYWHEVNHRHAVLWNADRERLGVQPAGVDCCGGAPNG